MFLGSDPLLEGDLPFEEKLRRYGRRLAGIICSDDVIRAQRIIVGTAERMPELGRSYDSGAQRAQGNLRRLFERKSAAGRLAISDMSLAVHQFMELASAGQWRQRLKMGMPPSREASDACADAAVAMFLAAYGRKFG